MTRDIQSRIKELESRVPRQPTEFEKETSRLHKFLIYAVAYYLGDPTPEGSVAEAHMRALGYPNSYEYRKALKARDPNFADRMTLSNNRLLAKFGVSWEHTNDEISEALKCMEEGFSEDYKARLREALGRLPRPSGGIVLPTSPMLA
jgi:hypothetical protein